MQMGNRYLQLLLLFAVTFFGIGCAEPSVQGQSPSVSSLVLKSQREFGSGNATQAIEAIGQAIELQPNSPALYQQRAEYLFRSGKVSESIADFDKVIELDPASQPYNWQRGIALYYVGRYADGREQFATHHQVNPDDVENTVWHFLCLAREKDVETARKEWIPSNGDARVPMMELYQLFGGKATEAEVLATVDRLPADTLRGREARFYAHLYLAIWDEINKNSDTAIQHLEKAISQNINGYMYDVAKVHIDYLKQQKK